jgi:serine/threonine protein kinase, bacterial
MTGQDPISRVRHNLPRGTQLNSIFEIDDLVSASGKGEVYRAHNIQTYDPVAIKIVLPERTRDEMVMEQFRTEARVLHHLHHEAIVRYYVFSIDATQGLPFLAMEFVDGPSLADHLKAGPLDLVSLVTLQRHLANGLEKVHRAGVIHRDIAPDNIIVQGGRVDRAKIIDFGIARSPAIGGGTQPGDQFAGDDNFVSPEQLGLYGGDVTSRSDIYSLGLVLAACALGHPLDMSGSQVVMIEKRRSVPDLSGIEPPLLGLIEAMLQPDPQDRPQSMAEVAEWPTFDGPLPEIETAPVDIVLPEHPSPPPSGPMSQLPAEEDAVHEAPRQPCPGTASEEPSAVEPCPARPRRRPRPIAAGIALAAILLGGLAAWAYVEYGLGAWIHDTSRLAPVADPPPVPAAGSPRPN